MKKLVVSMLLLSSSAFAAESVNVIEVNQRTVLTGFAGNSVPEFETEIKFKAMSGGCTHDSAFSVQVAKKDGNSEITIVRNIPDVCEAVARPVELTVKTDQIQSLRYGGKVTIKNPLLVNTGSIE